MKISSLSTELWVLGQYPVGRGLLDVLGLVPNPLLCDAEMSEILILQFSLLVNIHIK
jgi:hypothetical protein